MPSRDPLCLLNLDPCMHELIAFLIDSVLVGYMMACATRAQVRFWSPCNRCTRPAGRVKRFRLRPVGLVSRRGAPVAPHSRPSPIYLST